MTEGLARSGRKRSADATSRAGILGCGAPGDNQGYGVSGAEVEGVTAAGRLRRGLLDLRQGVDAVRSNPCARRDCGRSGRRAGVTARAAVAPRRQAVGYPCVRRVENQIEWAEFRQSWGGWLKGQDGGSAALHRPGWFGTAASFSSPPRLRATWTAGWVRGSPPSMT